YRRARRQSRVTRRGGIGPALLRGWKIPAARPRVQLRPGSVDRAHPVVQVSVDGHPLSLLPALDRRYVAAEVCRDFLPRIQAVFARSHGWRRARGCFAHRALLIGLPLSGAARIVTSAPGNGKIQHSTANSGTAAILPIAV